MLGHSKEMAHYECCQQSKANMHTKHDRAKTVVGLLGIKIVGCICINKIICINNNIIFIYNLNYLRLILFFVFSLKKKTPFSKFPRRHPRTNSTLATPLPQLHPTKPPLVTAAASHPDPRYLYLTRLNTSYPNNHNR